TYMATLYTAGRGAFPITVNSLRCPICGSTFYPNYFVQSNSDGIEWRVYYHGVPGVLKVRVHAFFDDKLCQLFRALTVHSQSSMAASARIYNTTLASPSSHARIPLLRSEDITIAFNLYSLLLHHNEQHTRLRVPESAPNEIDRLAVAMQDRNRFMAGTGQEQWAHACDLCRKFFERDGREYMLSCAITDGVSIGRPCCAVHNCASPLPTNRARFCSTHAPLELICSVEGCQRPAREGYRTCTLPDHVKIEVNYKAVGQSFNLLKSQEEEEEEEEAEVRTDAEHASGSNTRRPPPKSTKTKARFARRRTHNEQLIVRPCGVILGRATFYGAEALSSVADFLQTVFPTRQSRPDVLFFDNNCSLHRYIADRPRLQDFFHDTALVVDIFHFKSKHSESDVYCSRHCNAMAYPQLFDEENKRWTFNSSACEQTNAWLNKFHTIIREMLPVQYEFFLDEVIKERNHHLVEELRKRGHSPHLIPPSAIAD
ncbi:hypothetical protein CALVIDRAFT_491440, partial [Calocera viscosa TUFC12733]